MLPTLRDQPGAQPPQHGHVRPYTPHFSHVASHGRATRFDRTLQGLVDKVVPHLAQQDDEAEARFYKERGIKLKSDVAAVRAPRSVLRSP